MARHHLQLVTSPDTTTEPAAAVAAALAGGVDSVQLRNKTLPARDLLGQAVAISRICRRAGAVFVVNDRADVALLARAHGVHLGETGLPPAQARHLLPPPALVGVSVHSIGSAKAAAAAGADYITFGNIFPTRTHPGREGAGIEALAAVVKAVDVPVLAIGGITPSNVTAVLSTGCAGIAVISSIWRQPDIQQAARALRQALNHHPPPRQPFQPRPTPHRLQASFDQPTQRLTTGSTPRQPTEGGAS